VIVVSKDIFVEEEYLVEETPLEEPYVEECVELTQSSLSSLLRTSNFYCLTPYTLLSHSFTDPSMSTFLKSKTCIIYAPNLDQIHDLDMAIG